MKRRNAPFRLRRRIVTAGARVLPRAASSLVAAAILLAAWPAEPARAQKASLTQGPYRLEIVLEKMAGSEWQRVDPGLVLEQQDRVRFRATTNFDGYLYVMNQGTSGNYALLFPREDTGEDNQIEARREYLVPATEGAFRISGPPGHEVVYWMVSPLELHQEAAPGYKPLPPAPKPKKAPASLLPRCDDTILRARGDCVDTSAGPRAIEPESELPSNLAEIPREGSRQLLFMKKEKSSVVAAPPTARGPVIFEFRLAHK